MKRKVRYIDFFYYLLIFFYLLGLGTPLVYLLLLYVKKSLALILRKNKLPFLLIGVYIVSLLLSVRFNFFTFGRFFASIHNLIVLLFVPIGYFLGQNRLISKKTITFFLRLLTIILIPYIFITLIIDFNLRYNGILALISENKYTRVVFSMPYYLDQWKYSRIQFLGPYPTATAFYIVTFNTYRNVLKKNLVIDFLDILLLIIILFTGARFLLVIFLIQLMFKILIKQPVFFKLILLLTPFLIFFGVNIALIILESRQGSNAMRTKIYYESFKMMLSESPIIGIGIKPKIPEILGIYPMGSHSTINTFFYKTGVLGGIIFMIIYLKSLIRKVFLTLNKYIKSDYFSVFIYVSQILILLAIIFDDLDSDELYAFCFGLLMGIRNNE